MRADPFDAASRWPPGAVACPLLALFLWDDMGYNLMRTGWLIALEVLCAPTLLVCIPLLVMGVQLVRVAVLKTARARPNNGGTRESHLR